MAHLAKKESEKKFVMSLMNLISGDKITGFVLEHFKDFSSSESIILRYGQESEYIKKIKKRIKIKLKESFPTLTIKNLDPKESVKYGVFKWEIREGYHWEIVPSNKYFVVLLKDRKVVSYDKVSPSKVPGIIRQINLFNINKDSIRLNEKKMMMVQDKGILLTLNFEKLPKPIKSQVFTQIYRLLSSFISGFKDSPDKSWETPYILVKDENNLCRVEKEEKPSADEISDIDDLEKNEVLTKVTLASFEKGGRKFVVFGESKLKVYSVLPDENTKNLGFSYEKFEGYIGDFLKKHDIKLHYDTEYIYVNRLFAEYLYRSFKILVEIYD